MSDAESVNYGAAEVTIRKRADGRLALKWRENGKWMNTTRLDAEKARAWAKRKVRELDAASGAQWVSPAAREHLEWLRRLAGGAEGVPGLLAHVETALGAVQGVPERLAEAARWWMAQGGATMRRMTVRDAIAAFLAEYAKLHPSITVRGPKSELLAFSTAHGDLLLEDLRPELLRGHVERGGVAKRTMANRHSYWTLFFAWAVRSQVWPRGTPAPIAEVRRRKPDRKAPEIFTPEEGRRLLAAVSAEEPQHVAYLVVAGWLGCRPFECQRLLWSDLDEEHGLLHVRAEVARKVAAERWVPVPRRALEILLGCREAVRKRAGKAGHVCRVKSQNVVSEVARRLGLRWSIDVLRHSRITYRLQETGNIGLVAEESGNSPAEIRASYKRPIPPGRWQGWMAALEAGFASDWRAPEGRPWTPEELALLGTDTDAAVGGMTGRPTASVLQKRLSLGIARCGETGRRG